MSLLAAFASLLIAEAQFASEFGLWYDEIYSLWASDTAASLRESAARMIGDTNPPLYFAALRATRFFIETPREAILGLNIASLCATAIAVVWLSGRRRDRAHPRRARGGARAARR